MRLNFEVVHVQHPTPAQFSMFSDPLVGPGSKQPTGPLTVPDNDVLPPAVPVWFPRLNASHLAKGPNGIWYWRMTVPAVLRQRYPDLPKELRRSTQTAHRCHALAKARKMCIEFFVRYSNGMTPMQALDQQTHQTQQTQQAFTLSYVDGVVQVQHSPHASAETLLLMARCLQHVTLQVLGRGQRAANDSHMTAQSQPTQVVAIRPEYQPPVTPNPVYVAPLTPSQNEFALQIDIVDASVHEESLWLSDAIEEWRKNGGRRFSDKSWRHDYEPSFRVFRELVGSVRRDRVDASGQHQLGILDIRMAQISRRDIASLHANLKILPPNQGKSTKVTEAHQRIKDGIKDKSPRPSRHSVEKKLGHIAPFMQYAKRKGWISQEVLDEVDLALAAARGDLAKENQQVGHKKGYVALAADELVRLFEQEAFLNGAMHDAWRYWIPLICLYQGTRVAEAAQLYTSDFSVQDGIPCVSFINDEPEDGSDNDEDAQRKRKITAATPEAYRRLKNQASRRVVPLHPKLIELGLLEFVEKLKVSSTRPVHLFHGLTWSEDSLFGRQPSRYMRGLLKEAGIAVPRRKVPHSLRSNFHQALDETMLDSDRQKRLLGHATGNMKDERYGETDHGPAFPFAGVLPYLAQVDFGINVPNWNEVKDLGRIARQQGTLKRPVSAS